MKIPRIIKEELVKCGVQYQINEGSRHYKIYIGNIFCGIIPRDGGSSASRRAELNVRSQIRRTVKLFKTA